MAKIFKLNELENSHIYIYGRGYKGKIYAKIIKSLVPSINIDYIVDNDNKFYQLEKLNPEEEFYILNSIITQDIKELINKKIQDFGFEDRLIEIVGIDNFFDERIPFFHLMSKNFFNKNYKIIEENIVGFNDKSKKLYKNLLNYRLLDEKKIEKLKNGWFFEKFSNNDDSNQYLDFIPKNVINNIIEAGIYDGKSSLKLLNYYNAQKLYGFDPLIEEFLKYKDERMEFYYYGLWDKETELCFLNQNEGSKITDEGNLKIKVTTIDKFCKNKKIDLIKMDIEGAEMRALKGGIKTIKRDRPFLAISIYHSIDDFVFIPNYLMRELNNYQFEVNVYSNYLHEIILYALPKEKLN